MPYINVEDFLDRIYTVDFTTKAEGDIIKVSSSGITLTADTAKETVKIDDYDEKIMLNNVVAEYFKW